MQIKFFTFFFFYHSFHFPLATAASSRLLAGEHLRTLTAGVALDEAAPLKLAVALPHPGVLVRVVATATAHQVTAIAVRRGAVAQAALCADAARGRILLAVVRRPLNVHQVGVKGLAVALHLLHLEVGGLAQPAGPHHLHLHCLVVLVLQHVADLPELGQCGPAGLGGTGTRHAMAFALQFHSLLKDLQRREDWGIATHPIKANWPYVTTQGKSGSKARLGCPMTEMLAV